MTDPAAPSTQLQRETRRGRPAAMRPAPLPSRFRVDVPRPTAGSAGRSGSTPTPTAISAKIASSGKSIVLTLNPAAGSFASQDPEPRSEFA